MKYVVIDVEATNGSPTDSKIIEIGMVLFDGEDIIETYETLLNPSIPIEYHITKLTGITNRMVAEAPVFEDVADEIREFMQGAVFTAHNVESDYAYIQKAFADIGETFTAKKLCTVELVKKLLPELPKFNLDFVSEHFGITVEERHRALGDATATAHLLKELKKIDTLDQATLLINNGVQPHLLPPSITLEELHQLPEEAAIYYFFDHEGALLYIGYGENLKTAVMEHWGDPTTVAQFGDLSQQIYTLQYELTGNLLIANLRCYAETQTQLPAFNHFEMNPDRYAIIQTTNEEGYTELHITDKVKPDDNPVNYYPNYRAARNALKGFAYRHQLPYHLLGLSSTARDRVPPPHIYNKKLEDTLDDLRENLNGNMLITDIGRSHQEDTLVLIQKSQLVGYGYFDNTDEHSIDNLKQFANIPCPHTEHTIRAINRYLRSKNNHFQVIYF
jgi:DNA polymerase-3 subunit epsilon